MLKERPFYRGQIMSLPYRALCQTLSFISGGTSMTNTGCSSYGDSLSRDAPYRDWIEASISSSPSIVCDYTEDAVFEL